MRNHTHAIVSFLAITPAAAQAAVISVPSDAPTIQIAINLAAAGDEIVTAGQMKIFDGAAVKTIPATGIDN